MKFLFSKKFWDQRKTKQKLEKYHDPAPPFFVLMFFSSAMSALGLVLDSVAIVIGAMMIAPIITPVFGFALNALTFNFKELLKATVVVTFGSILGIIVAWGLGELIKITQNLQLTETAQIVARMEPNILHMLVAIFSGMVGAYAYSKEELQERIIGIAISVALIPPLTTIGLGIALRNSQVWEGSGLLYLTNLAGIIFGSIVVFILLGFGEYPEEAEEEWE